MKNTVVDAEAFFVQRRMARETAKLRALPPRYNPGLFRSASQARGYVDSRAAKNPIGEGGFTNPWIVAGDVIAMSYHMHNNHAQTDDLVMQIVRKIRSTGRNGQSHQLDAQCSATGPDSEICVTFKKDTITIELHKLGSEPDSMRFAYDGEQYVPVPEN